MGRLTAWTRRPAGWSRSDRGWLAVAFSAGQRTWALARPTDHGWEVIRQGSAAAPAVAATDDPAAATPAGPEPWAANLRTELAAAHDRVVTAVAGEDVVLRVLQLPAATPAELRQMLALQIDQLSPLADEEMVYDFEPLGGDDGQARVLVAIAHKDAVNQRVEILEAAGLPPEVVDVEPLSWFRALVRAQRLPVDDRWHALILVEADAAHLLVHAAGALHAVRTFGFRAAAVAAAEPAPPDGGAVAAPTDRVPDWDALLAECRRTIVALQIDQPAREPGDVLFVALTETRRAAVAELAARWPGATVLDEGSLPTLAASLSLEQARAETGLLNLLPAEWRDRRRRARTRRRLIRLGIAVIVMYALALLGLIGARTVRQAQFAGLQRQVRELEPDSRRAAQLESELLAMQRQLSGQASALEILREISALLPDNVKLTSFVFRRDESVALRGQADSAPAVYDFIGKLEQSPLFAQVVPGSVAAAGDLTKFDLVASLATAAPTMAERP